MAYSEKVVDHYNNPRNVGSFPKDTPGLGTGLVGAPECGDVMKLQIKIEEILHCRNCGKPYIQDSKTHIKKPVIQQIIHHGEGQQPIDIKKIAKALGAFIVPEVPCCDNPEVVPQNVITDSKFKTFGCGSAVASSSLATEWVKGKTIEEAEKIKNTDIVSELKLPPVKIHCSILAEDAIKAAIADFKEKQKNQTQQNKAG